MEDRPKTSRAAIRPGRTTAAAILILLASPGSTGAPAAGWMPLRNHNPFLQIFGLPVFEGAAIPRGRGTAFGIALDIVNHADAGSAPAESIVIDGESYYLNFSLRQSLSARLQIGLDLPLVGHANGVLDNAIEGWHDLWGLSNAKRRGPSNDLRFAYGSAGIAGFELTEPSFGIGDVRLAAALRLDGSGLAGNGRLALRAGIKLPTGDAGRLTGSGALDAWLGAYASRNSIFGNDALDATALAGVLFTGDSDRFASIQENVVPFAGAAVNWRLTPALEASATLYAQGSYVDSELEELGSNSVQLAVGGSYRFRDSGLSLSLGLVEDVISNATPDVAFHISLRRHATRSGGPK